MSKIISTTVFFKDKPNRPPCNICRYHDTCLNAVTDYNRAAAQYPNACDECLGAGEISYTENGAPHGEGFWPMEMIEPCECIENNKCPRCSAELEWGIDQISATCAACGLQYSDEIHIDTVIMPEPYCLHSESVYAEYADLYETNQNTETLSAAERNPGLK